MDGCGRVSVKWADAKQISENCWNFHNDAENLNCLLIVVGVFVDLGSSFGED